MFLICVLTEHPSSYNKPQQKMSSFQNHRPGTPNVTDSYPTNGHYT